GKWKRSTVIAVGFRPPASILQSECRGGRGRQAPKPAMFVPCGGQHVADRLSGLSRQPRPCEVMSRTTVATIHLGALRHNLARVRVLAGSAKVMAVVKADAYG